MASSSVRSCSFWPEQFWVRETKLWSIRRGGRGRGEMQRAGQSSPRCWSWELIWCEQTRPLASSSAANAGSSRGRCRAVPAGVESSGCPDLLPPDPSHSQLGSSKDPLQTSQTRAFPALPWYKFELPNSGSSTERMLRSQFYYIRAFTS